MSKREYESKTGSGKGAQTKSSNNNRSRRKPNKGGRRVERKDQDTKLDKFGNHPSWYAANPQLLSDAAQISYNQPLGIPFNVTTKNGIHGSKVDIASIAKLTYTSVFNSPSDTASVSPLNVAARNLYAWVRHANSGRTNYEAAELMLYILAMTEAYSAVTWATRIYGLLNTYSLYNRTYPKQILKSMGIDFENLITHIADFRYFINNMSLKLGSMAVPQGMHYIDRKTFMVSGVYLDDPSDKAQTMYFNPSGFYKFDATASESGGILTQISLPDTHGPITFEGIKGLLNELISPILDNEDMNIMSGDILKAYGADKILKLGTITSDFYITPVYDADVLDQINNAIIIQGPDNLDLVQTNNVLHQDAEVTLDSRRMMSIGHFLNSQNVVVTPEETMTKSRLRPTVDSEGNLRSTGTEVISRLDVYQSTDDGTYVEPYLVLENSNYEITAGLVHLRAFRSAPILPVFTLIDNEYTLDNFYGNIFNFTYVGDATIERMHETATYSLFTVPQVGRFGMSVDK